MNWLYDKAQEIISTIEYINIATITKKWTPWNTPVYTWYDKEKLTWYRFSWKDNIHSQNIRNNSSVFVTIYDSTVPADSGIGIYLEWNAYEISNPKEILHAMKIIYTKQNKKLRAIKEFLTHFPRRVYKFIPKKAWINGSWEINGNYIDTRTALKLEKLYQ